MLIYLFYVGDLFQQVTYFFYFTNYNKRGILKLVLNRTI